MNRQQLNEFSCSKTETPKLQLECAVYLTLTPFCVGALSIPLSGTYSGAPL